MKQAARRRVPGAGTLAERRSGRLWAVLQGPYPPGWRYYWAMICFPGRQADLSKVAPGRDERPEQRRYRPHDIHDPHLLRVAIDVDKDDGAAEEAEGEKGYRQRMQPVGLHRDVPRFDLPT